MSRVTDEMVERACGVIYDLRDGPYVSVDDMRAALEAVAAEFAGEWTWDDCYKAQLAYIKASNGPVVPQAMMDALNAVSYRLTK